MPVIVFANPKGGAGKSTACLVTGTVLGAAGASTSIIDCDRNQHLFGWRSAGRTRNPVTVLSCLDTDQMIDVIDGEAERRQFVLIDLEGAATVAITRAISRADFVVIPMQAAAMDASQAVRALKLIAVEERQLRRRVPHKILFTRTNPMIRTRDEALIMGEMRGSDIPVFGTHLHERAAFRAMFTYQVALDELDAKQVNGVSKAVQNAEGLVDEIAGIIRGLQAAA